MRKKKIIRIFTTVAVLTGLLVLVGSVLANNKKKNQAKTAVVSQMASSEVAVRVNPVTKELIDLDFVANGNFVPSQQMNFAAENYGRVVRVLVDEGSYVKQGQTLAIIKTDASVAATRPAVSSSSSILSSSPIICIRL